MDNNTKLLVGGLAAAVAGFALYKYLTKKGSSTEEESENFTADEQHFMNYVDEEFMGMYGTTDDLLMVGGCKPVEFANASSHNPPLATDEPNFANSDGADYLGARKLAKRGFAGVRRPQKKIRQGGFIGKRKGLQYSELKIRPTTEISPRKKRP